MKWLNNITFCGSDYGKAIEELAAGEIAFINAQLGSAISNQCYLLRLIGSKEYE